MNRRNQLRALGRACLTLGLAALAAACLPACGMTLSYTVDEDMLQRLPKASRRSVYQAETIVTIAIDAKGAVKRKIDNTIREDDRLEAKISEAKDRRGKASGDQVAKIDLEIRMLRAKLDYNDAFVDHQRTVLKLSDLELLLARAQFELAKAQLIKKHSIQGDMAVEDFEGQVKDIQARVAEFRKDVDEEAADLKEEENRWLEAKKAYFAAIGESSKGWWTEQ
ncbi:MAG TPA: hypothetical protein PK668_19050 [Myxococcota bacterium]|nr:hypothetical protein [Myxococcota bacterium]HRY95171.1 hypothetical protein [Myxococcota bacterium]